MHLRRHRHRRALTGTGLVASAALVLGLLTAPASATVVPEAATAAIAAPTIEPPDSVVALLRDGHPRLLADEADFDAARLRVEQDERVAGWFAATRATGDAILPTTPVARPGGSNILSAVREVKRRVLTLGFLWQVTGEERYAERGIEELLSASAYPDWSPAHFLDVGEMTGAVAVGYDWMYDAMDAAERATVRAAIEDKALEVALPYYDTTGSNFFVGQTHNWNLITNSVALGALAIGDESPQLADAVLTRSITSIQYGISEYAPDGAYAESPSYWQYGTDYLVSYLAAMTTATGTDFGLSGLPGLAGTGDFGIHVTSPTGHTFNYGDGGTDLFGGVTGGWHSPFMMWLADRYDAGHLAAWQAERADRSPSPLDILWYDPATADTAPHPTATDATFGNTEIATARSAWDDPYAVYVATKGLRAGYDQVNAHMNLDAGDLVVEANGIRWFEELGADTYQDQYFTWKTDSGGRWNYFATRAEGQNTMVLGDGPVPSAALTAGAPVRTAADARRWYSVTDLTGLYGDRVERAERGVMLYDDRRQVLVQDEVESADPIDYRQFLLTRAQVTVADGGRSALLERGGQRMWLQLLTPEGRITAGRAAPLPWVQDPGGQKAMTGVTSLLISVPDVTDTTVAVRIVPLDSGQQPPSDTTAVGPIAGWAAGGADAAWLTGLRVDGAALPEFDAGRFRYDVTTAAAATRPPAVTATAAPGVQAKVERSGTLPGVVRVTTRRGTEAGPTYVVHVRQPGVLGRSLPVASVRASADDGNAAASVVDGSLGTRWSAEGDGQHVTLDLGAGTTVGALSVAYYNGHTRTSTFDVLTSTDGATWQTALAGEVTSGTTDDLEVHGFAARTARYVRLVGHGNSASAFNSITEIRAYASGATARADQPVPQDRLGALELTPAPVLALSVGEDRTLGLAGTGTGGGAVDLADAEVRWFSANPGVATVAADGTVTGVSGGSVTVGAVVRSGVGWSTARTTVIVQDPGHIEPGADAVVRNAAPDGVFGKGNLEVRNNPDNASGFERVSYLTFPLDAVGGRQATAATLHVYGWLSSAGAAGAVAVHRVADPTWTEAALTWNTMPARAPSLGTITVQDATPRWYEIDVTDAVRAAQDDGTPAGFALTGAVASYGPLVLVTSREGDAAQRPYLDVEVS
ncbi:DNRLRE domain-containing protein [Promicromonospora sp. NPDC059942]|uniref:CBM96 family carbohydrate-binding protein n=1 Tax=Promicromonospora sp. NPDC059942 TaxID=3347009 RepID=UPI00366310EE